MSSSTDAAQTSDTAGEASGGKRPERKALGKYEIQKKIGAGGMGTVFLALDTELRRTVALKVLPRERAQNPMLVRRFKSGGQAAAHLRHANLVTVFEAGEIDGYLYIALEYVDGTDVHHLVEKRGPVPVKRSIAIVRQVAKALDHAYEQNIVHRDIKPSNLLIQRDGSVKLADFGLARSLDEETETGITRAGTTVGTVDYMSPEQARDSKAADIRSDLYSLGCTWYHMLTGAPPYPDGAVTNKLHAHASDPPPDPREKNPSVPEGVVAIMHRLMAKDPAARYQTPAELLAELDSPVLGRQTLSNNVLARLADGDAESPAALVRHAAPPAADSPPVERKPLAVAPVAKSEGLDPEVVRYAIVGAIVLGLLALFWWVISQFASTVDPPSNTQNPFAATGNVPRTGDVDPDAVQARSASRTPPQAPSSGGQSQQPTVVEPADHKATADTTGATTGSETESPAADEVAGAEPVAAAAENAPAIRTSVQVAQSRRGEQLPDWVAQLAASGGERQGHDGQALPVLTVGRASGEPGDLADFETALARLPRTGGVIRLVGPGPFELTPTRITVGGPLVVEAAPGDRPVVMLRPHRNGSAGRVLQVEGNSLLLSGLDLVAVAGQFAAGDPLSLLEVIGGDLAVQDCSITLVGTRDGASLAIRSVDWTAASGAAARADPARVLLDRVFIRGNGLSALAVERGACDAVVNQSLFVSDGAPVFVLSSPPSTSPAEPPPDSSRLLRLFSTTAVSTRSGFFLEHTGGEPPPTRIASTDSIIAAPPGGKGGTLLEFGSWPGDESTSSAWAPRELEFEIGASRFPGWDTLIRVPSRSQAVSTSTEWARFWDTRAPLAAFPQAAWPKSRVDPATAAPAHFDPTTVERTASGPLANLPGCPTAVVPEPAPEFIERAVAMSERPIEPTDLEAGPLGARTVTIDASREDLGAVISRGDWTNGTRFQISGSGVCRTTPIEVRGKSLSIEFAADATDLCIEPQAASFAAGGRALFTIEDGSLRLMNGCFRIPADGESPRWFLHVTDGNFSLIDCAVEGPLRPTDGAWEGFIRWDRRNLSAQAAAEPGQYERFGRITNSYVCGSGAVLRADVRGGAFVARGSVLATTGTALVLNVPGNGDPLHAAIDLSSCTLAAGEAVFDVRGRRRASGADPLRLFVEQTVFAPLPDPSSSQPDPVLLSYAGAGDVQGAVRWWGRSNGYADGIRRFLRAASSTGTADDGFARWSETWGAAGEIRPLHGENSVRLLIGQRPASRAPTPQDFALEDTSPAATWAPAGGAIGANPAAISRR